MKLLIVEDEAVIRRSIAARMEEEGVEVRQAAGVSAALEVMRIDAVDAVLCDVHLPDGDGFDLLRAFKGMADPPPCILMTAFGNRDIASRALQEGALDYVAKPLRFDELLARLQRLEEELRLKQRLHETRSSNMAQGELAMLGDSQRMEQVRSSVRQVATGHSTVLLEGETGVGKGVIARLLHNLSAGAERPFVRVNCAAIPEALIESELFGHKRGAFTGAEQDKPGLLAEAEGGTLFLDEIGDLPLHLQAKLLHVLDDRHFRPLGAVKEQQFSARVVAATNVGIAQRIAEGRFRQDLFYRLNVMHIVVPPLRQRSEDIVPLAMRLTAELCEQWGRKIPQVASEQWMWLETQPWPGNARELRNTIERAMMVCASDQPLLFHHGATDALSHGLNEVVRAFERRYIRQTIVDCGDDKVKAAARLGVGVSTLYRKLEGNCSAHSRFSR
ncbi:MAG: sigma-54 dependent transcriptional regulator [Mariprofundales bacterium]|nr:sigma-54 dependent transcriptional regulator [Mariprofundales bacterium]